MGWTDLAKRVDRAGTRTFGEAVTYTPNGGAPVALTHAVYNAAHELVTADDQGLPVSTRMPVLGVHAADLVAAPAKGDAVTVGAVDFTVVEVHPDGSSAGYLLILERA